jgi:cation transporter-like permease
MMEEPATWILIALAVLGLIAGIVLFGQAK